MKKFKKTISRGLPGGPNEEITEITGAISVEGYKISSPDKDNTFNIIPSSNISMKDVEFPILGTDNLGNSQVMMPGAQYTFPGDMVIELPMMADGGRCWPGYKPVSGKMAYSKGSCEKAQDGEETKEKYYNPEIEKGITSGDWKQDFLYRNQWLMDVPYLGDYIKNKAREIASTGPTPTRDDYQLKEGYLEQDRKRYDGSEGNFREDTTLLDQYFSKEALLPLSTYKPTSDYLEFLPSYSIKANVDRDRAGNQGYKDERDNAIKTAFIDMLIPEGRIDGYYTNSYEKAGTYGYNDPEVKERYAKFLEDKKPIYLSHKYSSPLQEMLGVDLAGHKTGMAWDEEVGLPYISISDAWDFSPDHYSEKWSSGDKLSDPESEKLRQKAKIQASLMHKAGTPFKVYDRFYFDPQEESIKYYTDEEVEQLRNSKKETKKQYGAEIIKKQNDILRRQAFAESSFNPKAESPAGAQGLTQFTPTTVKELQRLGFVNEDFDIFDPKQAVEAQRAYMTYIQNKPYIAKGSNEVQLAKALYAYNRGPSAALRNLTKLKGQYDIYNSLDWIEGINEESRGYIQKVLGKNPEFNIQYDQALKSEDNKSIVDLYQVGGESNMFKIYKDFIMGEFDTSESYPEAEKIFDRLNRVYYKEAKEAGMSPANYIMTNIVTS